MHILNKINSIENLKKLSHNELVQLCKEIRTFLIDAVSETGGHLASNLGAVELTVALHYCFNFYNDKLIWDVGHQSYTHKILTNRKSMFSKLRQYKGLSGFPKSSESEFDFFDTGHSSTSISAALGYALTRDLNKENYNVISVIGDGALTGGLAFEALNNTGRTNTNMLIILNDNQMSISENVGSVTKHLNDIRSTPSYIGTKKDVNMILKKLPLGKNIIKIIGKTKDTLKYILVPGVLFKELGFEYYGPIDGHDISELIKVFNKLKTLDGPILLHIHTKKGKGYIFSELHPEKYHGVSPFDSKTGEFLYPQNTSTYSDTIGKKILQIMDNNKKVIAITAAMPSGTGIKNVLNKYPSRVFDVGIAEQHAVTFAAGAAKNNFIPIVLIYSTFLQRAYDQIIHDVCIQKLHVIFAIDRAGIVGEDGETHQGVFDLSYLTHIPNITVIAPKDCLELEKMLDFAIDFDAPIAIRYPRGSSPKISSNSHEIIFAESEILIQGSEIALLAVGSMCTTALDVVTKLNYDGLYPSLINIRFIKPLDKNLINSLKNYKCVFVLEDNLKKGGCFCNILEELNTINQHINIYSFSFDDTFIEQGSCKDLFKAFGLDSDSIYKKILQIFNSLI